MADTSKALDALTQWQAETRQQIVNELGNAILKALHKLGFDADTTTDPEVAPAPRQRKRRSRRVRGAGTGIRPGTDLEKVYREIKEHPGNKGFQVQALLAQKGIVVHERTLRTCLNR